MRPRVEKKIKVLVIGAKGMLGQELADIFEKDGDYEVFAWDKEELDITKEKEVDFKVGKLKPLFIINAVAYNAVDKAEDPQEFKIAKKLNGGAPGYLAKIAKKTGATFVHYSTDYVFDGEPDMPEPKGCSRSCFSCTLHKNFKPQIGFDENARPNPVNNYGRSKLLGEKNVQRNSKKYYIIRLSRLFGKPGKSQEAKKSFFDSMLEFGRNKKHKEARVIDEEISCFTYAPDLAKKTKEMLEAKKPFGIYHIVNEGACTWHEAVLELYKQSKIRKKVIPINSEDLPRPARRPYHSALLNTKLHPLRDWKSALKDYLRVLKK